MIRFEKGNLFDSQAQTLINTVNCVGVMGKGVALAFKKRYPDMYKDYRVQCKLGKIQPGKLTIYKNTDPWVINFPTKRHWKERSRLEYIDSGLQEFVRRYKEWGVKSVALPALGCGNGGLNWSEVKPLIEKQLGQLNIDIDVYEPVSELFDPKVAEIEENDKDLIEDMFGNLVEPPGSKAKSRKSKKKRKK